MTEAIHTRIVEVASRWLDQVVGQMKYAARSLMRRPALAIVGLVTIALGIGANSAIFSIVNAVLLQPLPFRDPGQLVMAWSVAPTQGITEGFASYPDFRDWKEQTKSFDWIGDALDVPQWRRQSHRW